MPVYKQLPKNKKKSEHLPFYRPVDHLVMVLWERRKALRPFLAVAASVLVFFFGMKFYSAHYEEKAGALLVKDSKDSLEEVVRNYPRSHAANVSRMKLGKKALDQKNWDQASEWYGQVAQNQNAAAILRVAALQDMALASLKKGDAGAAVASLEKAAHDPGNQNQDYTQLLIARAQEVGGNKDKAKEIYKSLSEGGKNSPIKEEAKERLSWLE